MRCNNAVINNGHPVGSVYSSTSSTANMLCSASLLKTSPKTCLDIFSLESSSCKQSININVTQLRATIRWLLMQLFSSFQSNPGILANQSIWRLQPHVIHSCPSSITCWRKWRANSPWAGHLFALLSFPGPNSCCSPGQRVLGLSALSKKAR